jgi:hypothetical protein
MKVDKLYRLRNNPVKVYGFDDNGDWVLLRDEKAEDAASGGKLNHFIKNYNGGVSIDKIHGIVPPLREGYYRVLRNDVGGDAPKDFIQVYEYGTAKKSDPKQWEKHIAKVGHKWYPLESVSEYLLNRIGEVLGLEMAYSQLRMVHGQLRFLSRYFLKEDESLFHGARIYSTYLVENDDRFVQEIENLNWSRALFTFQFTNEAVKFAFPNQHDKLMNSLVRLLVFDAISGNNDRHFYNWGVITNVKEDREPRFSPIYDSARGLFWNEIEEVIERKFYEGKGKKRKVNNIALNKYIRSSRPKIGWDGWEGKEEINHFELIQLINHHYPEHKKTCNELLKNVHLQSILKLLSTEFKTFYSPLRYQLMSECLKQRFEHLQKLCNQSL